MTRKDASSVSFLLSRVLCRHLFCEQMETKMGIIYYFAEGFLFFREEKNQQMFALRCETVGLGCSVLFDGGVGQTSVFCSLSSPLGGENIWMWKETQSRRKM